VFHVFRDDNPFNVDMLNPNWNWKYASGDLINAAYAYLRALRSEQRFNHISTRLGSFAVLAIPVTLILFFFAGAIYAVYAAISVKFLVLFGIIVIVAATSITRRN